MDIVYIFRSVLSKPLEWIYTIFQSTNMIEAWSAMIVIILVVRFFLYPLLRGTMPNIWSNGSDSARKIELGKINPYSPGYNKNQISDRKRLR